MKSRDITLIANLLNCGIKLIQPKRNEKNNSPARSFPSETLELHNLLIRAEREFEKQEYRYSLFWSRIVLEKSLKHIALKNDEGLYKDSIYKNLKEVEKINIFNYNYLYHLHMTRKICNRNDHEIENEYGGIGAYYVIKQLKVLLAYIDENIYSQSSTKDLAYE